MRIKKTILLFLILIPFLFTTVGCGKEEVIQKETYIPVQTLDVTKDAISRELTMSGEMVAEKEVNVSTKVPGKMSRIYVEVGQEVKKGAALLELENADLRASVEQAKQNLVIAKANLEKVLNGARKQEVGQVNQQVNQAKIKLEDAKVNVDRMEKLHEAQAISKQQYEQALSNYQLTESAYQSALEQQSLIEEGADEQTIRVNKAQVDLAEANLKMAEAKLNDTIIRSPINGKVGSIHLDEGEFIMQGNPVIQVVEDSKMSVLFDVTEKEIGKIKLGDSISIQLPALNNKSLTGTVTEINLLADKKLKIYPMEVTVDNTEREIRSGMTAIGIFQLEKKEDVIVIPIDAMFEELGEHFVFVTKDGKSVKTKIVTGISNGNLIEVRSGLNVGDRLIVKGQGQVSDGDLIKEGVDSDENS